MRDPEAEEATETKSWPSIDVAEPDEEGGPVARAGFNYQDEIAVSFLIEMLENPALLKIHFETHDDLVLVRAIEGRILRTAEYVQVKAGELDKLWSISDLCQRKKREQTGTSIFEISLGRDKYEEISIFRIVTLRPVVKKLKVLTFERGSKSRSPKSERMKNLCADLEKRYPGITSAKGNGTSYWADNCLWDQRHDEKSVRRDNLIRLVRFSVADGRTLMIDQAEVLLDELRAMAKAAGDAKWDPDRDKKIIDRITLRSWWVDRTNELAQGSAVQSGGKLTEKMEDACLSDDLVKLALEMRLDYAAEMRSPRYLEVGEVERLRRRVRSEVSTLRARFVAGEINVDSVGFHSLCLQRMDELNAEREAGAEDHSDFLKGCMYDIADRCLLKFTRRP